MTKEENISDVSINETIGAEVVEVPITHIFFTFSAIVSSLAQISNVLHPSKDYVMSKFVCDVSSSSDRTIYRHWIISDYCPQSAGLDNLSKKNGNKS